MKEPFKLAEKQNRWLQDKARKKNSNKAPFLAGGRITGRRRRQRRFPSGSSPGTGRTPPPPRSRVQIRDGGALGVLQGSEHPGVGTCELWGSSTRCLTLGVIFNLS